MKDRIKLAGTAAQNAVKDGIGQALRDAYAIVGEGDARLEQLLEQIREIKGEPDSPAEGSR